MAMEVYTRPINYRSSGSESASRLRANPDASAPVSATSLTAEQKEALRAKNYAASMKEFDSDDFRAAMAEERDMQQEYKERNEVKSAPERDRRQPLPGRNRDMEHRAEPDIQTFQNQQTHGSSVKPHRTHKLQKAAEYRAEEEKILQEDSAKRPRTPNLIARSRGRYNVIGLERATDEEREESREAILPLDLLTTRITRTWNAKAKQDFSICLTVDDSSRFCERGQIRENAYKQLIYNDIIRMGRSDTLFCCAQLEHEGFRNIYALNFANHTRTGGAFFCGNVSGQEEDLFRCTSLSLSLWPVRENPFPRLEWPFAERNIPRSKNKPFYPLGDTQVLVSPVVEVFTLDCAKSKQNPMIELPRPFNIGVITGATADLRGKKGRKPKHFSEKLHRHKIRSVMHAAIQQKADALVLGSWGSGCFEIPADRMARLFASVFNEIIAAYTVDKRCNFPIRRIVFGTRSEHYKDVFGPHADLQS